MTVEAYPLAWPQGWERTKRREDGRFGVTFARARDELLAEISRLRGTLPVISSNMQMRRDGLPYANQPALDDPGIAVYFTYKGKQMCFACDKYRKVEANMRAIQLTISAIRGIERWGASDMMERAFTGFTALPDQSSESWWVVLGVSQQAARADVDAAYRALRSKHHPDKGGDPEQFQRVQRAYEAATKGQP
jgi:hypothetical protein